MYHCVTILSQGGEFHLDVKRTINLKPKFITVVEYVSFSHYFLVISGCTLTVTLYISAAAGYQCFGGCCCILGAGEVDRVK
jgi:hypothetical protein